MPVTTIHTFTLFTLMVFGMHAVAGPEQFVAGDLIEGYGPIARVDAPRLPAGAAMKVMFNVTHGADEGQYNRSFDNGASYMNLQYWAGVPVDKIHVAFIVSGPAHRDILNDQAFGSTNPSAPLVKALLAKGAKFYLCGQSAAYRDVSADDVIKGVEIALSGSTTATLLHQQGYALSPF
ncbi:hypothetical protein A3709_17685 [Halioglobus sp. HI00S01]|nr:hypothetical protein A3709_17685 [Halioglobus sp. HI00S01]